MKKNSILKKKCVYFLVLSCILLYSPVRVSAFVPEGQSSSEFQAQESKAKYAPGEVLVTFRDGVNPQTVLQSISLETRAIGRIHPVEPVVVRFKRDNLSQRDQNGYYRFMGNQYGDNE